MSDSIADKAYAALVLFVMLIATFYLGTQYQEYKHPPAKPPNLAITIPGSMMSILPGDGEWICTGRAEEFGKGTDTKEYK